MLHLTFRFPNLHCRQQKKGKIKKETSPVRIELTTSRLTVERANRLRHGDDLICGAKFMHYIIFGLQIKVTANALTTVQSTDVYGLRSS